VDDTLEEWFIREVIAHEAALMRYLTRVWPRHAEIQDLRQEVYVRVFEAAGRARPLMPKSFLFTTARNLMADRVRRERIVSIESRGDVDALNVLVDEVSPEQRASAHQELAHLAQVFDLLPSKCREVLWLRKVEDLSQREVASRLGLNEKAVEKQVARGVRLLAAALFGGAQATDIEHELKTSARDPGHGKQHRD
jgi:RNA polymerase sigma-70 factor (ECF subfamily)